MYNITYTMKKIKGIVNSCLQKLRRLDKELLDINVNERTITHKLAEYLQEHFPEFNVDCEYNRDRNYIKRIRNKRDRSKEIANLSNFKLAELIWENKEADTIYPDIIVHKRTTHKNNLLIIEVKKKPNPNTGEFDKEKIEELMERPYNYKFGLFLRIDLDDEDDILEWFPQEN